MSTNELQPGEETSTQERVKIPRLYKVILHNDNYTPMEFVIQILTGFFQKNETEATHIMLNVHHKGSGIAGVYPCEIAESKTKQVQQAAHNSSHPLRCTFEPE